MEITVRLQKMRSLSFIIYHLIPMRYIIILLLSFLFVKISASTRIDSLESRLRIETDIDKKIQLLTDLHSATYNNYPRKSIQYPLTVVQLVKNGANRKHLTNAYRDLGISYIFINELDSAELFLEKGLKIADSLNDTQGRITITRVYGNLSWYQGNLPLAIIYYSDALNIARENNFTALVSGLLSNLGTAYYTLGDFKKSVDHYEKALTISDSLGNYSEAAICLNDAATIYKELGYTGKALEYFLRALELNKQRDNQRFIAVNIDNIAGIYFELGDFEKAFMYTRQGIEIERQIGNLQGLGFSALTLSSLFLEQDMSDSSLYYVQLADSCFGAIDSKLGMGNTYLKYGDVFLHNNMLTKSIQHYNKSYRILSELGNEQGLAHVLLGIGKNLIRQDKYSEAIAYLTESMTLAREHKYNMLLSDGLLILAEVHQKTGNLEKSIEYLKENQDIKDSIAFNKREYYLVEQLVKFDTERKENEIVLLNQQNELQQARIGRQRAMTIMILSLLLALTALFLILFYRYREKKKTNLLLNEMNTEIEAKKSKIEEQNILLSNQTVKLRELDELKSKFFTNISHEIRTPLTLIMGPAERLLSTNNDTRTRKSLEMILKNSELLLELINQLLDIARIEKGMVEIQFELGEMVSDVAFIAEMFKSKAAEFNNQIEINIPEQEIICYYDKDKFHVILSNLLSNAIKNTRDGKIVLSLKKKAGTGKIELKVADTGQGIPPEYLPHIFDRFYMVANHSVPDKMKGSGIGLAYTREIVNLLKGTITVQSEQGMGTAFTVTLPLTETPVDDKTCNKQDHVENTLTPFKAPIVYENSCNTKSSPGKKAETILLIEDHEKLRDFLHEHLSENFRVIEAENGEEGFNLAKKENPALIISDIMMPGMDGYELSSKLKSDEKTSHIPIILLTAKATHQSKMKGLNLQVDDYITKPFSFPELEIRVNNILAIREKLRSKYQQSININAANITTTSADALFLEKADKAVKQNIDNPGFSIEDLCAELAISRSGLHRKLKAITGLSTTDFIRSIRMKHAALLIKSKAGQISEIAFKVGFSDVSYFSKCFKKQFGSTPTEFLP
ncbi:MAG: tetratricopeptide repeat protein [Bacteroidota bacterium]